MKQWQWRRGTALFGAFTAVLLLIGLFWPASGSDKEVKKASANTTSSTSTTATTVAPTPDSECPNSWGRSDSDKAGNRWIAEGIPAIRNAKTEAEAHKGIREWTDVVRKDPALFAGALRYILHKDVTATELFDNSGCATSKAVGLLAEMETALALSSVKPDQAPQTGYNSGADPNGGGVHVAGTPGIKGDRASARIDLKDGTTIWIMARCGNPVTMKPPSGVPHGPTDNPPPKTPLTPPGETTSTTRPRTTTTTRPTTTSTTAPCPPEYPHGTPPNCKDDPSRDPEPQGNNRPGGGGTAPPVSGPAGPPAAGPPPAAYVPPPPPTAPSTTRPPGSTAPPAPSTTTAPPTTGPPVTGDPGGF